MGPKTRDTKVSQFRPIDMYNIRCQLVLIKLTWFEFFWLLIKILLLVGLVTYARNVQWQMSKWLQAVISHLKHEHHASPAFNCSSGENGLCVCERQHVYHQVRCYCLQRTGTVRQYTGMVHWQIYSCLSTIWSKPPPSHTHTDITYIMFMS